MKKITILMASILAMVGCAQKADFENETPRARVEMSVSAVKNVAEASRVAFNGAITDMIWEASDNIGVHVVSTFETATFAVKELSDDSQTACFRGEVYEPAAVDSYHAFYPANTGINGTNVNFILPETTTGASVPYLVASHENAERYKVELMFRPVTALLELTLGFAADKVTIQSVNGESLAGTLTFNCADGSLIQPAGSSSVSLLSPVAGTHYLYMPEVTLAKGYKVIVEKDGAQMIKTVSYGKEKKFVAGQITPLSITEFEGVSVSLCDVYTTYTLAQRKNSEANNTANTNIIFFNGNCSFKGISSTLVKECGVNCGGTTITATASNKQFSVANQTNKGQGAYEVYAYIKTVDGATYTSAKQTVYITGLPYSVNMKGKNAVDIGWTTSGTVSKNNYGLEVSYKYGISGKNTSGNIFSPTFYLPENTNISYSAYACFYTGGQSNASVTLYSGVTTGTTANQANSNSLSLVKGSLTPGDSKFTNCSHNAVMSAGSTQRLYIGSGGISGGSSVTQYYATVRQVTINYRW